MLSVDSSFLDAIEQALKTRSGETNRSSRKQEVQAIAETSRAYNRLDSRVLQTENLSLMARLRFFLPRDMLKSVAPLLELAHVNGLPVSRQTSKVLDLGAGLGSMTFGLAHVLRHLNQVPARMDVTAIDVDREPLTVMQELTGQFPWMKLATEVRAIPRVPPSQLRGPYDFVFLGLVLNELDSSVQEQAALLQQWAGTLSPGGSLIVVEPALKTSSRHLHKVREELVANPEPPFVFGPCLHQASCPMLTRPRDWCHEDIQAPLALRLQPLARKAGLRDRRLTFSYLTLRNQPIEREGQCRIVSGPLKTKGKLEFLACEPEGLVKLQRLDRHRSESNADFGMLSRGAIVDLEKAEQKDNRRMIQMDTHVAKRERAADALEPKKA